jgi:hypothetical protein
MRRIPTYVEIYTGRKPEPRELARFHARHGYVPDEASAVRGGVGAVGSGLPGGPPP